MRVFLTGATGWIGSAVIRELIDAGHEVVGLARTPTKAALVSAAGATPRLGNIVDLDLLRDAASRADAVVHTAFGLDLSKIVELAEDDRRAIHAFGEAFAGSTRPIIVTSGFLQGDGRPATEDERPAVVPAFPRASEQTAFELAKRGIHASVVRNPRSVHGKGETHGFMPMLATLARAKGVSAYVGDGDNRWPAVHRLDAARVYRLALERGACGEAYHAVAEEGIRFREIAEAIGRQLGMPVKSLTDEEAQVHFGPLATWVSADGPASNEWTRATLNWKPRHAGLVQDVERPDYSA